MTKTWFSYLTGISNYTFTISLINYFENNDLVISSSTLIKLVSA